MEKSGISDERLQEIKEQHLINRETVKKTQERGLRSNGVRFYQLYK